MRIRPQIAFEAEGGGAGGAPAGGAGGGAAGAGASAGGAGGGAGGAPPPVAFAETLPEDIRGEAAFRDIKDLGSLAKGFLHAQRLIGADPASVVKLPGGADDKAAWDGVYAKLGRPEKADGYKFSDVQLPEGLKVDDGMRAGYQEAAHKAGLSAAQADQLYAWYNSQAGAAFTAQGAQAQQQAAAGEQSLRTEWGTAFDQNLGLAKEAIQHYGGDKLRAELDANGMGNSPELARIFAKIGRNLREDGLLGRGGGAGDKFSPAEAQQQIAALRQDKAFAADYTNKSAPGHKDAVAKMQALYQQAFPPG